MLLFNPSTNVCAIYEEYDTFAMDSEYDSDGDQDTDFMRDDSCSRDIGKMRPADLIDSVTYRFEEHCSMSSPQIEVCSVSPGIDLDLEGLSLSVDEVLSLDDTSQLANMKQWLAKNEMVLRGRARSARSHY
jgi:hypothetical protein